MKSFKQFLSEDSAVLYHGSANIKRNGWTGELRLDVAPNGYSRKVGDLVDSLGTWWTTSILDARTISSFFNDEGERESGAILQGHVSLTHPRIFDGPDEWLTFVNTFRKSGMAPNGTSVRRALNDFDGIIIRQGGAGDGLPDGGDYWLSFNNAGVSNIKRIE